MFVANTLHPRQCSRSLALKTFHRSKCSCCHVWLSDFILASAFVFLDYAGRGEVEIEGRQRIGIHTEARRPSVFLEWWHIDIDFLSLLEFGWVNEWLIEESSWSLRPHCRPYWSKWTEPRTWVTCALLIYASLAHASKIGRISDHYRNRQETQIPPLLSVSV